MRDQRKIDAEQLKLLAIFHFVVAGLTLIGIGFLFLHWFFLHTLFSNPEIWKNQKGGPPPKEVLMIFQWFYFIFGGGLATCCTANLISGWAILKRRARVFTLIVAGLDCVFFPFGTCLGVFTFIIILRDTVRETYEAAASPAPTMTGS